MSDIERCQVCRNRLYVKNKNEFSIEFACPICELKKLEKENEALKARIKELEEQVKALEAKKEKLGGEDEKK